MEEAWGKGGARVAIEVDHTSLERSGLGLRDGKSIHINDKLLNGKNPRLHPSRMHLCSGSVTEDGCLKGK